MKPGTRLGHLALLMGSCPLHALHAKLTFWPGAFPTRVTRCISMDALLLLEQRGPCRAPAMLCSQLLLPQCIHAVPCLGSKDLGNIPIHPQTARASPGAISWHRGEPLEWQWIPGAESCTCAFKLANVGRATTDT